MSPELVRALVGVLEAKDLSTAAHTWRVVLYTRALAEEAGLDHEFVKRLTYGAALHDVGKIEIPDEILQKPGRLTPAEFEVMKTHAALGHERLLRMDETDPVLLELVRHHHERWDGLGYPDKIAGNAIPVGARIFSVIDTFDAMTSLRPYRMEVGEAAADRALETLHRGVGSSYWKEAVEMFERLYRTGSLGWILEYFNDSCPVPDYGELAQLHRIRGG